MSEPDNGFSKPDFARLEADFAKSGFDRGIWKPDAVGKRLWQRQYRHLPKISRKRTQRAQKGENLCVLCVPSRQENQ
jgi:hypothetical protein